MKVKPRHTLDLVVLAAEWGTAGEWLAVQPAPRRARSGDRRLRHAGQDLQGLTDELLRWQTERLLELADRANEWVVDGASGTGGGDRLRRRAGQPALPGGVALRFARVLRYRDDKTAAEADTIDAVRAIHAVSEPRASGRS